MVTISSIKKIYLVENVTCFVISKHNGVVAANAVFRCGIFKRSVQVWYLQTQCSGVISLNECSGMVYLNAVSRCHIFECSVQV